MAARTNTLVSSSIPSVLRYLSGRFSPNRTSSQPLLYVLSPAHSLPAEELSSIVSFLTSVPNSVGCLGSTLPLSVRGLSHRTSTTVLSLAQFDSTKASTFRSEIPGKPEAQVGRWHRIRKADDPTILTPPIERGPLSHPPWLQGESFSIPSELLNFSKRVGHRITSIVYLSDNAPEGLSRSLTSLSSASKVGFIASSTPFVTGRPFTLFHNTKIHSSGAVGICAAYPTSPDIFVEFPGLRPITDILTVTSSEGNLVHSLNQNNPSRLLLNAIEKYNSSLQLSAGLLKKEDNIYLGVLHPSSGTSVLHQVYHIISGDPSRGTIALEGEHAPVADSRVQFLCLKETETRSPNLSPATNSLNFLNLPTDQDLPPTLSVADIPMEMVVVDEDTVDLQDVFLAASENGCIVSRTQGCSRVAETPWKTAVPYGLVSVDISSTRIP